MKVLLSNDDGYFATGIQVLLDKISQHNGQFLGESIESICVIAPDQNRSAASNSLTLSSPLRLQEHSHFAKASAHLDKVKIFGVNGTPTDCVHLGVNGVLGYQPDIVISGINSGANMGDDVIYSGTVAAATEGRFLGKPSIAISLCGDTHFETAAKVLMELCQNRNALPVSNNCVININVPDIPYNELKGVKVTRLGKRHASEPVVQQLDPRGLPIHWIGPAGSAMDATEGTDFEAVETGYVSVTPLMIDLTDYGAIDALNQWNKQ
ncbi:5'/3'-nucleotidase SurE [Thiomicrorhabdus indica]|uniref:5'/3'-nucleotidase SurE n=1 Tax=Thiomicrorhabdus indica TaxID=2267253 RepID=UPI002AA94324|nr:5'/3'-nucleotidase SurE [Thiomicrorhabdus indica]